MKKPSQQFIDNFNLVMKFYGCTIEEAKFEKQRIIANFDDAERCYNAIVNEIKSGVLHE